MRSKPFCAIAFLSLLATTACIQTPAQVEMKGHYVFGRNGPNKNSQPQYSYAPPRMMNTHASAPRRSQPVYADQTVSTEPSQQTAGIQSVAVNDLAPPPRKDSVWASKTAKEENSWAPKKEKAIETASKWHPTGETYDQKPKSLMKTEKGKEVALITQPRETGFIWPVNGKKVISSYGPKGSGKANDGMNIAASQGEPVWAVADGEVVFVGDELSGYGNMVLIKHAGNHTTTYAHLNQATVDKYDRVKQGDIIGYIGSTGNVKTPQLYFAVREGKEHVNPQTFLSRSVAGL